MRGIPLFDGFRTYHVIVVVLVQPVQVWPLKKIHKGRQQLHHQKPPLEIVKLLLLH
jgi:hypothetical protein